MKKGYIMIAAGAACWGSLGAFSTVLFEQGLSSLTVANFRVLLTTLIMGLYLAIFHRHLLQVAKKDLSFFAAAGFISVCIFNFTYITAISLTNIVTAVILLYTAPVFVTILSRFIFKEQVTPQKTLALLLTLIGCALVVEAYDLSSLKLNFKGILTGLSAGFTYGLYSIFSKKALETYSPWTTVFYSFVFGSLFISLFGRPWEKISLVGSFNTGIYLLLIALIPTVLAYTLYTAGLKYVESSKASIIATVEPVVAVILAAFIFHAQISIFQFAGILLVLGSVILIQIPTAGSSKKQEIKQNQ
ncbi:drug/metabolite transporter (DMT)-like permease [Desulfohalotomaculum tongense]|uniref:DMT family transporter n=1 Tax=Desulforadius tongensis TaxID=1216062 RepID=UPI001959537C|nr:EamA family transporter [Desulforadius tongensis]MBM7856020.1 drug/metabolite transporter (DMT)-like permease [Desulforadius tongensis]